VKSSPECPRGAGVSPFTDIGLAMIGDTAPPV